MFCGVAPTCSGRVEAASARKPVLCGGERADRTGEAAARCSGLGGTSLLPSPRRAAPHHVGDDPPASQCEWARGHSHHRATSFRARRELQGGGVRRD
eukprot:921790-Pyramimonas_sp.AAC.1